MEKEQWQQLADFHFNETSLPEKTQLYLTGISALAVGFMQESNATNFTASAELPHKATGKRYKATYSIEEIK
jgi:hypothetical protein